MDSLGDVWHLGSEDLESLQVLGPPWGSTVSCCTLSSYLYGSAVSGALAGSAVSGALGGPQCHLLHSFFLSLCIP